MKNSISGIPFESSFAYRQQLNNWEVLAVLLDWRRQSIFAAKYRVYEFSYYYVLERDYGQIPESECFQIDFLGLVRWAVGVW